MDSNLQKNEREKTTIRHLETTIDKTYPRGWFAAIENNQIIAAAADFDQLVDMLRALGKDPRDTLVVEAGGERYGDYVTIFI